MKYLGTIKNRNNETIEVSIITNNDDSQVTELTLAGEAPIIIAQTSSDGLFSPIKSRSCTITIVSKDTYFDMYSGSSHGTSVKVINVTRNQCLFFGYLTPCEYNQPYLYLNQIELEAVDAVSTLQDFKYQYQNNNISSLVSISSILRYCLNIKAGYLAVYVPQLGLKMKTANDFGLAPTEMEYISEEAFISNNDAMTCYEVLEEICNFYNVSLVPFGTDVFLIDYELISKYGVDYNWLEQDDMLVFKNITDNYGSQYYIPTSIEESDYCGDSQNIEIDEVYNKVSVKAETKEITDNDLMYDPLDDINSSTYFNAFQTNVVNKDNDVLWTYVTRLFEYIQGSYGEMIDSNGDWQTLCNVNSVFNLFGYKLTDNFSNSQLSNMWGWAEFPYPFGKVLNSICGQTCMPAQQFGFEESKPMPYSSNWNDTLMFFPQFQWIYEYYKENGGYTVDKDYSTTLEFWKDFYENHMGGTYPVLIYNGKKDIQFSPSDSTKTNYLAFTGDLLWQQTVAYDHTTYKVWEANESEHIYGGALYQIKDTGAHSTHNAYSRGTSDSKYNQGWPMLKIKLSIGDKYWNGSSWQNSECAAWIPYHKENVKTENETLIWTDYNKPVTNFDYTYKIGKDAYVIPITETDGLHGRLKLQVFMPMIPFTYGLLGYNSILLLNANDPISQGSVINYMDYNLTPPVIFMKGLSLELISTDNDREHWYKDFSDIDKNDDDIIYSNQINTQYVTEFDDLDLKVNTYNSKKPISQSYILEPTDYNSIQTYDIMSTQFSLNTPNPISVNGQTKYMYEIKLEDYANSSFDYMRSWYYDMVREGLINESPYGIPVRVKENEDAIIYDGYLDIIQLAESPYVVLRLGNVYNDVTSARNDLIGYEFIQSAYISNEIQFMPPDATHILPPLSYYPPNLRRNIEIISITKINKVKYHTEGFYRAHTNTTVQEEMNIVNKYVEHYSTPKKIYNCQVHGYFEPYKCITVNALNGLKMVIDEQEYDVKANTNELKLIEY